MASLIADTDLLALLDNRQLPDRARPGASLGELRALRRALLADLRQRVTALPRDRGDDDWDTVSRRAVLDLLDEGKV